MATVTAANVENPKDGSVPNDMFPISKDTLTMQPPASSHGGGEESKVKSAPTAEVAVVVENDAAVADAQKKMDHADTPAERLDSSKELNKMDTAKSCVARFYERLKKSELLQFIACNGCAGPILAKIIMEFSGKGDQLPIQLLLAYLALNLCHDVVAFYSRKLAEKS